MIPPGYINQIVVGERAADALGIALAAVARVEVVV